MVTAYSSFGAMSKDCLAWAGIEKSSFEQPVVKALSAKYEKKPAQVLLRWAVQLGLQVIPKSPSADYLVDNFSIEDFELTEAEMKNISDLNKNVRFNDPGYFLMEKYGYHLPIFD